MCCLQTSKLRSKSFYYLDVLTPNTYGMSVSEMGKLIPAAQQVGIISCENFKPLKVETRFSKKMHLGIFLLMFLIIARYILKERCTRVPGYMRGRRFIGVV